jgi:hypothetical protein
MASLATVGVAAAVSLAGCGVSVTVAGSGSSSPASTTSAPPATTTTPPPTTATTSPCDLNLTGCLMTVPSGAVKWTNPDLGDGDTTIDKFVGWVYGSSTASDRTAEISRLSTAGVVEVSHRDWYINGHDQANIYLIRFNSPGNAASDLSAIESSAAASSAERTVTLSGVPLTTSTYAYTAASQGYMEAKSFALQGDIVMELFFFSPTTLDTATMSTWVNGQLAALGG